MKWTRHIYVNDTYVIQVICHTSLLFVDHSFVFFACWVNSCLGITLLIGSIVTEPWTPQTPPWPHKILSAIILEKIYLWKILTMLAAEYGNQSHPIENNDIGQKTQLSECLCSGVDQPFFCFCVFVLINLMCFMFTCWSDRLLVQHVFHVSTLILVFWCLHVGQT